MNAIIVEDEVVAARNLKAIINEVDSSIKIIATLDSIKSSIEYFSTHEMPDLVFMDIQLADGSSFSIFKSVEVTCPVIFTTAYDSYALEAFKVNSIDYLLKPIEPEHVSKALNKLRQLSKTDLENYTQQVTRALSAEPEYTRTLLVTFRDKLIPISVSQIAFFYTQNEVTTLTTFDGKEWQIDKSLEMLMSGLDPSVFFRANRQFIIAHRAIKEVVVWFGNRLSVTLTLPAQERIVISKARVSMFKRWIIKNDH